MATVTFRAAVRYGISMLGYGLIVVFMGVAPVILGIWTVTVSIGESPWLVLGGALEILVGMLLLYAGLFGAVYKVIADGVALAIEEP